METTASRLADSRGRPQREILADALKDQAEHPDFFRKRDEVRQVTQPHAARGSPTATATATKQRPRNRRERGKPEFHPTTVYHSTNPEAKTNEENLVDEDAVRLDYEFLLRGGREEVVRVKSQLVLPMALALEILSQTDVAFPELVDQVIVRPLVTKFRAFLQRRFDVSSRAAIEKETAEKETPAPAEQARLWA